MKDFERGIEKIKSNFNNLQRSLGSNSRYGEHKEISKKSIEKSKRRHAIKKSLDKAR